ncbi:hypothetical protein [Microbacterium panaciterrae]|uniref:hypothetical protein n=1 Tax=Microbacterium panaciterrae TaxID=985759 RepID=UPI0031E80C5F
MREADAARERARWHTDPEHRARQIAAMAERRRRRAAVRAAVARIPLVRAAHRPVAPIMRPGGWQIADPAAWCAAGLYNDADVTAVLDPSYARGDLWSRAAAGW